MEADLTPAIYGVVRWRRTDLQRVMEERFAVGYHERTIGKLFKAPGFSRISAKLNQPSRTASSLRRSKNYFVHAWRAPRGVTHKKKIEIWFEGGAHKSQKMASFGCGRAAAHGLPFRCDPVVRGTGAALALPFADTDACRHLDEIALRVARGINCTNEKHQCRQQISRDWSPNRLHLNKTRNSMCAQQYKSVDF
ncbi:winged helix-turn-helix domain-containing protein [Mesorhizobium sp. NPDC059025]|uniref:winged helix-turn-helix domain-containing protein n=1 Tax=unclassified Mesorhizobium TaxID=325217 RepID=UPI003671AE98